MNEERQIIYMQVRIIRLLAERFNLSLATATHIFSEFEGFAYIKNCFGMFHVEGDEAVLEDVINYLKLKGALLDAETV